MPSTSPIEAGTEVALKRAVADCSERCLHHAARWASELLLSLSDTGRGRSRAAMKAPALPADDIDELPPPYTTSLRVKLNRHEDTELEQEESDIIATGRALIQARELRRASHRLEHCKSPKARYLYIYCLYMDHEKRAGRDWTRIDGARNQSIPTGSTLSDLVSLLQNETDPWLLFLKALFLRRLHRREEAMEAALLSLAQYPWNWATWTVLGECLGDGDELATIVPLLPLPNTHFLVQLFQINTLNALNSPGDTELNLCERLLGPSYFANSQWLMAQRACVFYHLHDYARAEKSFAELFKADPYRLDDIDILSHILYVREDKVRLSKLAHEITALEKDRPDVCCVLGNYYSLRLDHEKAVKHFRRATQLDPSYLSAWTLLGHEYVEMKNPQAAIEAYRKAIDVNRKEATAWYGLAQGYELLSMHQYALHYYQHATTLRPDDQRIWKAQGLCYEDMGRPKEAIRCLKRSLRGGNPNDISTLQKLADVHDSLGEFEDAAGYHMQIVELYQTEDKPVIEYAKSCVYVAQYHLLRGGGNLDLARSLLDQVAKSNAEDAPTATELLRKLQAVMEAREARVQKSEDSPQKNGVKSPAKVPA